MAVTTTLPTLYQLYTAGGIKSGLSADQSYFKLNEKNITLYSGAMHYFRTPKQLWRDRLRKMRAAGLNAVETYVPWNLHEPEPGKFDFGKGGTDMEDFLDIEGFLKTAQEEDLLAIIRPGPYICGEWEFGGFPSWLLREKDIKLRTSDTKYMTHVKRYFNALLPILAALQFTKGGPIVALQVENEYGSTKSSDFTPDKEYLKELRQIMLDNNITELLFTADGVTAYGDIGTLPEYFLITANFGGGPNSSFQKLQKLQPYRPKMAMEFYPGWFDHWGEQHHTANETEVFENLELILKYPGSFNLYMMHGGTSFGFMNGANLDNDLTDNSGFQPDITSYDYDAVLTEAGDYTEKYTLLKDLLKKYADPPTKLPEKPKLVPRVAYPSIKMNKYIPLKDVIDNLTPQGVYYKQNKPMEMLDINNGSGQSYGYLVYRKEHLTLDDKAVLTIQGHVCDTVMVLLNGKLISPPLNVLGFGGFGYWKKSNSSITLTDTKLENATLDLVVENWGRVGYGKLPQFNQFKGIWQGDILINNETITDWLHIPMEFTKSWTNTLKNWITLEANNTLGPGLYTGEMTITENITDTYIDMRNWTKGIVIVNGFVLGRYAKVGPQQCLYLPAPFIKNGRNKIIVFEHYEATDEIAFSQDQIWKTHCLFCRKVRSIFEEDCFHCSLS